MKLARIHLLITKRVEMLSEHPESTIEPTKTNAFDVAYMDPRTAGKVYEFGVLVLLLGRVIDFLLLHFVDLIILL